MKRVATKLQLSHPRRAKGRQQIVNGFKNTSFVGKGAKAKAQLTFLK